MKQNKKTPSQRHKITTIFGYSLFGSVAISFLLTTMIPMTLAFQHPGVRHLNVTVMIVVFAIATILPTLAAYFIGNTSTRSKKVTLHHYNGVLFGFAAYWVVMLVNWIGFTTVFGVSDKPFPAPLIATNLVPVVTTVAIMTILAFVFAKKQKQNTSVLEFAPYQYVLVISSIGALTAPYITDGPYATLSGISNLIIPLAVIAIAYLILRERELSRFARISDAFIAMSIGWVSIWVASSFLALLQIPYYVADIYGYIAGLVVFSAYLYLRTR